MKPTPKPTTAKPLAMRTAITDLRIVGTLEGVSFLLLVGVAMPMKYVGGMPLAVRIAGTLHGFLFTLYVVAVVRAARSHDWSFERSFEAIVASLYPLGTFLLDRKLREEAQGSPTSAVVAQGDSSANDNSREGVR